MGSDTGKGDTMLNKEQKLVNLRKADWYVWWVDVAIPFEQKN
jgi:hypothetical protein